MDLTRRTFFRQTAGLAAAALWLPERVHAASASLKVGSCRVGLKEAKQAGLDGVEISAGDADAELDVFKAETRAKWKAQMQETGLPICSVMMGLLNSFPLATDPRAPAWLTQCIHAANDLGAKTILLAFFGRGDLLSDKRLKELEFKAAVQRIRAAAPCAKDAGVTLAIENFLSAAQNVRMLEEIGHDSVRLYYDVFNTGKTMGYDAPAEIRMLKGRIAQIHFKSGPRYLDEDKPYFEEVTAAIKSIGYSGWIVLETSSPSNDSVADAKRNGDFLRSLLR